MERKRIQYLLTAANLLVLFLAGIGTSIWLAKADAQGTLTPAEETSVVQTLEALWTQTSLPAFTPKPTTPTATSPPTPASHPEVYDLFDDSCLNVDRWGMAVEDGPTFLTVPTGGCWNLEQWGLVEQDNGLYFEIEASPDSGQSYILAEKVADTITAIELEFDIQKLSGDVVGIGLFTRLSDPQETWAYYWLRFTEGPSDRQGNLLFEAGDQQIAANEALSVERTITLTLTWDGNEMHLLANGLQVIQPVAFADLPNTFGLYWLVGPDSSLAGRILRFNMFTDS